jgi:hypothetical protein
MGLFSAKQLKERETRLPLTRQPGRLMSCYPEQPYSTAMVEARGVEPLSEDRQRIRSTCVADSFSFATTHAHRLA